MDPIELLKNDHKKTKALLKSLEENPDLKLLAQVEKEIKIHSKIEEELFYPAFRDSGENKKDEEEFFEALEEHHVVDLLLLDINQADPKSEGFKAKATVLKELIEHHIGEEEKEMFPKAHKRISREELNNLGIEMQHRKNELEKSSAFDTGFMTARTGGEAAKKI